MWTQKAALSTTAAAAAYEHFNHVQANPRNVIYNIMD